MLKSIGLNLIQHLFHTNCWAHTAQTIFQGAYNLLLKVAFTCPKVSKLKIIASALCYGNAKPHWIAKWYFLHNTIERNLKYTAVIRSCSGTSGKDSSSAISVRITNDKAGDKGQIHSVQEDYLYLFYNMLKMSSTVLRITWSYISYNFDIML